ncbi:UDP-N-acetylmuramoyl-L-alanine--D-glutamate ligase [Streptomyces thinghirensis]|nr:UDP-N-acetylmuramoyl-L-alanine--D-glutamate ligase [Streptomyces thinghirensis]
MPFDFQGKHVTVAGLGVSGVPAAKVLHGLGARVTVVNDGDDERARAQAAELEALGVPVRLGDGDTLPDGTELIVTAPGWKPTKPLFTAAGEAGVPVWGDVELAWRLRGRDGRKAAPWLAVTGTNGKTTTVQMLASILKAAGLRTAAVGNIGVSLLDAVTGETEYDVLAVELSSYQLHWAPSLRAHSATVLNLAPDHLDWHGSMEAYAADKGRVYEGNQVACVHKRRRQGDRGPGPRGRRRGGLPGDRLHPRHSGAGSTRRRGGHPGRPRLRRGPAEERQELAEVSDVNPPAPHNIANALAAAALGRAFGVPAAAVRDGLQAFTPDAHRIAHVADVEGVAYVDDSKATNTHATEASLAAYESIVWIAGGLAKGATFDELVTGAAKRLRGAVLIRRRPRPDPRSPGATRPRSTRGRPRPDRHWCDAPGRPGGPATRPARRHGAAGPGLCLHGYVHQLQQAR